MRYYGLTDKGLIRKTNQDCFLSEEIRSSLVAVLCDGMGGHASGELASRIAAETFLAEIRAGLTSRISKKPDMAALLKNACLSANHEVCEHAHLSPGFEGMGTTLVGICLSKNGNAFIANIGDSRCYILSSVPKRIRQVTTDHSLVEEYVKAGIITREEARSHPKKNIITRAVGMEDPKPEPDIFRIHLFHGQALFLCSDGLSNYVEDSEILRFFGITPRDPEKLCRLLLEQTLRSGAGDNVTMFAAVRI